MHEPVNYDDAYVRDLFDRMGTTYDLVNHVSSFGFCRWWRAECVDRAEIRSGDVVCDLMAGGGECWGLILRRARSVVSIDFSPVMIGRQRRRQSRFGNRVDVRCENAMGSSIPDQSVDVVVCAYGLKTPGIPGCPDHNRDAVGSRIDGRSRGCPRSSDRCWAVGPNAVGVENLELPSSAGWGHPAFTTGNSFS
jgi:ubiE/COQ5 methyltransferase family